MTNLLIGLGIITLVFTVLPTVLVLGAALIGGIIETLKQR